MPEDKKFEKQDEQYVFPYHHLVSFAPFSNHRVMLWGFEYYAYISKVIELIMAGPFTSLLDVGCGDGKMILELSQKTQGKRIRGIDLSARAILFAKAFNYKNGAEFDIADIAHIAETFDVITLVETIEHVPDAKIKPLIDAVYDHTVPGGRVIVSVPTVNFVLQEKHYRHYDLPLLSAQFDRFTLESASFVVKRGMLYALLTRLSRKFCTFGMLRSFFFFCAKKLLFAAAPDTGRHLVCVFKKT